MPKPKGGLGRGLGALIPAGSTADVTTALTGAVELPIETIASNPRQPRQRFDTDSLQELTDSIREHGVLQPILVRRSPVPHPPVEYEIIAGERRWRAALRADQPTIPAIIKDITPQQQLEIALVENIQRNDLSPYEQATAYRTMVEEFDMTQEQIARRVGKSRVTVTNTLRLLDASNAVLQALLDGQITEGHARALLGAPTVGRQKGALELVVAKGLSVRATEEMVRRMQQATDPLRDPLIQPVKPLDATTEEYEQKFRAVLGTKVELFRRGKAGRLTIHYYNEEQLEDLYHRLGGQ